MAVFLQGGADHPQERDVIVDDENSHAEKPRCMTVDGTLAQTLYAAERHAYQGNPHMTPDASIDRLVFARYRDPALSLGQAHQADAVGHAVAVEKTAELALHGLDLD